MKLFVFQSIPMFQRNGVIKNYNVKLSSVLGEKSFTYDVKRTSVEVTAFMKNVSFNVLVTASNELDQSNTLPSSVIDVYPHSSIVSRGYEYYLIELCMLYLFVNVFLFFLLCF